VIGSALCLVAPTQVGFLARGTFFFYAMNLGVLIKVKKYPVLDPSLKLLRATALRAGKDDSTGIIDF
jgi:hypothetical protein